MLNASLLALPNMFATNEIDPRPRVTNPPPLRVVVVTHKALVVHIFNTCSHLLPFRMHASIINAIAMYLSYTTGDRVR
eukprot:3426010-Amphidinium_carterae.1